MTRLVLVIGSLASAAVALLAPPAAAGETARTLARVPYGWLDDLAQDGPRIAWIAHGANNRCPSQLRIRHLPTRGEWIACSVGDMYPYRLVLGGRRALGIALANSDRPKTAIWTGAVGEGRLRALASFSWASDYRVDFGATPGGDDLTGVGADGPLLAFSHAGAVCREEPADAPCPPPPYPVFGGVERLVGGKPFPVPHVPPALALAVAGGRIALVPAPPTIDDLDHPWANAWSSMRVEVRDATAGELVATVVPPASLTWTFPPAILLSKRYLVLVAREGNDYDRRVLAYRPTDGVLVRDGRITGAYPIGLSGDRLLFVRPRRRWSGSRVRRTDLRLLNLASGARRTVITVPGRRHAGDFSIERRRVVWSEMPRRGSFLIRALRLR